MPIPDGIKKQHILWAAEQLDGDKVHHRFKSGRKYVAVVNGRQYPCKALIGVAAKKAIGQVLTPQHFYGGVGGGGAATYLRQLGIEVRAL